MGGRENTVGDCHHWATWEEGGCLPLHFHLSTFGTVREERRCTYTYVLISLLHLGAGTFGTARERKRECTYTWYLSPSLGAGTFGTVRAGVYKPKNGGPEVECAVKVLKPADELPNQKVRGYWGGGGGGGGSRRRIGV